MKKFGFLNPLRDANVLRPWKYLNTVLIKLCRLASMYHYKLMSLLNRRVSTVFVLRVCKDLHCRSPYINRLTI